MKRFFAVLLALLMIVSVLSACGSNTAASPSSSAVGTPSAAPSNEVYEMVIALHTNDNTIEDQAIDRFAESISEKSGGRLVVTVYPGATIGNEEENLEQIGTNEIQGSIFGDVMTSQLAADLDPTVTPFLFSNIDDILSVWNGEVGERINEACIKNGNLRVLGVGRRGARYLLANKEITAPDQLAGLKLRLPSITNWVNVWNSMGALATPIAFSEVYTSLQTGVVDAFESTAELTYSGSYFEVVHYAMNTHHLYGLFHFAVCESWLQSLPEDLRELVVSEGAAACAWGDEQMESYEAKMVQGLVDKGMVIVEVDENAFKEAAMPAIQAIVDKWQDGIWDAIKDSVS